MFFIFVQIFEALFLGGRGVIGCGDVAFVGKIVGDACEGVDGVDVRAKFFGDEAAYGKVFVVFGGEGGAARVGFFEGHKNF